MKSTRSLQENGPRDWLRCSNCLQALDEEKRAVVLLAYYRGLSREALAQALRAARADDQDVAASQPRPAQGLLGVMTVTPDDDFAAAEYALGTLDPSERAVMAARRLREPDLDEAIRAWEARLAPLAEAAGPIEPPRDLLPAIEARIRSAAPEAPGNAAVASLRRSVDALARGGDRRLDHRRRSGGRVHRPRDDARGRPA